MLLYPNPFPAGSQQHDLGLVTHWSLPALSLRAPYCLSSKTEAISIPSLRHKETRIVVMRDTQLVATQDKALTQCGTPL